MPPTPIPDDYGIATVRLSLYGTDPPIVCTWGYHNGPSDLPDTVATNISTHWLANFTAAKTCHHYHYFGVHVLQKRSGMLESGAHDQDTVGTLNASEVSPAVAPCITKHTSFAGRKYRGRVYLPAAYLSEANVDEGGLIDSATVTSLQAAADGFFNDMHVANYDLSLLHRDGTAATVLTSLQVRQTVRTQRGRQTLL